MAGRGLEGVQWMNLWEKHVLGFSNLTSFPPWPIRLSTRQGVTRIASLGEHLI